MWYFVKQYSTGDITERNLKSRVLDALATITRALEMCAS
jgi:hypothetical protein